MQKHKINGVEHKNYIISLKEIPSDDEHFSKQRPFLWLIREELE
jgi:hypothetical protein